MAIRLTPYIDLFIFATERPRSIAPGKVETSPKMPPLAFGFGSHFCKKVFLGFIPGDKANPQSIVVIEFNAFPSKSRCFMFRHVNACFAHFERVKVVHVPASVSSDDEIMVRPFKIEKASVANVFVLFNQPIQIRAECLPDLRRQVMGQCHALAVRERKPNLEAALDLV